MSGNSKSNGNTIQNVNNSIKILIVLNALFIILECVLTYVLVGNTGNNDNLILSVYSAKTAFLIGLAAISIGLSKVILCGNLSRPNEDKFLKVYNHILYDILGSAIAVLMVSISLLFTQICWGIDNEIDLFEVLKRIALSFFPFLRIASIISLIFWVTNNVYATIFTGLLDFLFMGTAFVPNIETAFLSGFNNVTYLFSFETQTVYSISPENGIIYHTFFRSLSSNVVLYTILFSLLSAVVYYYIGFILGKKKQLLTQKQRILFLIPVVVVNLFLFFIKINSYYLLAILGVIIIASALWFAGIKKKNVFIIIGSIITVISLSVSLAVSFKYPEDYIGEFENIYNTLKERYILSDLKKVDWDVLYNKYYPQFVKANTTKDGALKYKLFKQLGQEFFDGHINYMFSQTYGITMDKADCMIFGNDYGFSLLRLDTGEYVAINVEGSSNSYSVTDLIQYYTCSGDFMAEKIGDKQFILGHSGIHNGTIITSWNGMSLDTLCNLPDVYMHSFSDVNNKTYFNPVYAAGIGGDSVEVTFINDNGIEESITLDKIGAYAPRLYDSLFKLNEGYNINNLECIDLNDDTALLRINGMIYGSDKVGCKGYSDMKQMIRDTIIDKRINGKENLIIDLRSNTGGSPLMSLELASLFAPKGKNIFGYTSKINEKYGLFEKGIDERYIKGEELSCVGEDLWNDGNIVLLVNDRTISAGDQFTYFMSGFPNVKVIGITRSNSSGQGCIDIVMLTGQFTYSAVPILDVNGNIMIDTDSSHIGNVPIDVIIPTTKELVTCIFDGGRDYVLEYALAYLNNSVD